MELSLLCWRSDDLCSVQRDIWIPAAHLFAQMIRDQFAVEAAVLDEYFAGARTCHDYSRNVNSGNI